jgi:hypothetical protein
MPILHRAEGKGKLDDRLLAATSEEGQNTAKK